MPAFKCFGCAWQTAHVVFQEATRCSCGLICSIRIKLCTDSELNHRKTHYLFDFAFVCVCACHIVHNSTNEKATRYCHLSDMSLKSRVQLQNDTAQGTYATNRPINVTKRKQEMVTMTSSTNTNVTANMAISDGGWFRIIITKWWTKFNFVTQNTQFTSHSVTHWHIYCYTGFGFSTLISLSWLRLYWSKLRFSVSLCDRKMCQCHNQLDKSVRIAHEMAKPINCTQCTKCNKNKLGDTCSWQ